MKHEDSRHLFFSNQNGLALVEAVVAVGASLAVLLGILGVFAFILKSSLNNSAKVQASYLAEEGLEAVRILRDNGWNANIASVQTGTPFYLAFDGSTWQATTTNNYVNNLFERQVVLDNVYRDSNQNIVTNGGTLDPNTKKATVSVAWSSHGATTTETLMTYFSNIFNN